MKTKLGRTGLEVNKDGFGALPIQRISFDEAAKLLNAALDGGINFIDSAHEYSDSEAKIGQALSKRRNEFTIATKTVATNVQVLWSELETSLKSLKTDCIDIYQFHNMRHVPRPGDGSGLYEAMLEARQKGMIRFIGITSHRGPIAKEAVESGLYDTLQFPFSYLSSDSDVELVKLCAEKNMGFIAMKGLSGGLLTDIATARAWLAQFPNAVPIWGIQRMSELESLFEAMKGPNEISPAQQARIDADRKELMGNFCRGCGYCMPCPKGITLNWCVRMPQAIRRMPTANFFSEQWQADMEKTKNCREARGLKCGLCKSRCPYGLDVPAILPKNYADYREQVAQH